MLRSEQARSLLPYALLALFFGISIAVRPLLPVDETRYLSVAWEMYIKQDFLVPTLNFEPYFQKPPLLFWLIDAAWAVLGVSRMAAIVVIFLISSLVILLSRRMAIALFPDMHDLHERVPWLMLGSVPFVIYSSLILFDLLLTACVLGCFLCLWRFAHGQGMRFALLAGLCLGLGVLTKGPVVLIHLAFPVMLYALWRQPASSLPTGRFLSGFGAAVLVAAAIVFAWLGPALYSTGRGFAYGLIWEQSAGRVAGSANGAHARPFYFYVLLTPLMLLPWGLSPELWASKPWAKVANRTAINADDIRKLKFLTIWCIGELLIFSMISGKQPHYLVPLLPAVIIIFGYFMGEVRSQAIKITSAFMLFLFAFGQAVAAGTIFYRYDLAPVANFVALNSRAEIAFAGRYQGELTFLARLTKPLTIVDRSEFKQWLEAHPSGYLITKTARYPEGTRRVVYSQLVEDGYLLVLSEAHASDAALK